MTNSMNSYSNFNNWQNKELALFYVVSTPIGNLRDITFRAAEILKNCDYIICEDSRITKKLIDFLGICKSLIVYNEHSDKFSREKIINLLKNGHKLALVSDAGTPLISDPGYKLISELRKHNFSIDIAPGASAPIAALTYSAMPSDKFAFLGFLPKQDKKQQELLSSYSDLDTSLILFEKAMRVSDTLINAYKALGNKYASVTKELTKLYQEVSYFTLENGLPSDFICKGEIVIIIDNRDYSTRADYEEESPELKQIKTEISFYANITTTRDLTQILHKRYKNKIAKKTIYNLILEYKQG